MGDPVAFYLSTWYIINNEIIQNTYPDTDTRGATGRLQDMLLLYISKMISMMKHVFTNHIYYFRALWLLQTTKCFEYVTYATEDDRLIVYEHSNATSRWHN